MSEINNTYRLMFLSNTNEKITISIPRADTSLDAEDIMDSMDDLIKSGIVVTGTGMPTIMIGAELYTTEVSTIDLD